MPLAVAPGVTETTVAHIRAVAARLRLVNRRVKETNRRLDALTANLAEGETASGQEREQHDVTILRSLPGVGRIVLATLLTEAWEITTRCAPCPALLR
jgi:hypothetical protein